MHSDESILWERLAQSRRAPVEPSWLGEIYSPSLSIDLRRAVCEKLGMFAEQGWPIIQLLLDQHGLTPDLVMAAGLCHQPESRDWLVQQLHNDEQHNDALQLSLVEALSCWGADVPQNIVVDCLNHPAQQQRLAGLQLLIFRAYTLSDQDLLQLCEPALQDFRDPVVIAAIRLLQRRDGVAIAERLSQLSETDSESIAEAAIRALGCIGTSSSQRCLLEISQSLKDETRRKMAHQQLAQQF
jgi:hypothetical protein